VELDGLVRDAVGHLGGEELRHRDLGDALLAGRVAGRRVVDELARRLDLGREVGDGVAQRLLVAEGRAERLALTQVLSDGVLGPESSITKLLWSELYQKMTELSLGPINGRVGFP
jgi:hypothetical protein